MSLLLLLTPTSDVVVPDPAPTPSTGGTGGGGVWYGPSYGRMHELAQRERQAALADEDDAVLAAVMSFVELEDAWEV